MEKEDLGKLILRVALGLLMLFHGVAKLRHGIAGITANVVSHGLPVFVAYGVYVGEVLAPVFLIAGLGTRVAAAILAVNMVFAVWLAHAGDLLKLSAKGGAYALELQALYFFGAIAVALFGAGRYSISRGKGRLD